MGIGLRLVMTKPIENSDNQEWISIFLTILRINSGWKLAGECVLSVALSLKP